jgi:hypothetical protein
VGGEHPVHLVQGSGPGGLVEILREAFDDAEGAHEAEGVLGVGTELDRLVDGPELDVLVPGGAEDAPDPIVR